MTARRPKPRRGAGLMQRLRCVSHGDSGMALPLVIALMVVGALLVAGVASTSLSAVGSATSTRASVQAQAVAEAGLAAAQSAIIAGHYTCTYPDTSNLGYVVQAQFGSGISGAPPCSAPTGAKAAVTAQAAIIVSTATASRGGTQGNSSGDTRRVQGVLTLETTSTPATSTTPTTPATTTPPGSGGASDFTRAVFVGGGGTSSSGAWTLNNGTASTGGLYVNGMLACSQIQVNGPTVVSGGASFNTRDCRFGQDVSVSGNLDQCQAVIAGRLTVLGTMPGWLDACTTSGGRTSTGTVPQESMPVVTASTYGSSTTWAALSQQLYTAHGVTQWQETRFAPTKCKLTAPSTVRQDGSGDSLNGPIDAPASVKVIDARACTTLEMYDSTIVLSGDLTIIANSFTSSNGLQVKKASSVPAGTTPTLRIVVPMADGTSTCSANSGAGTITINSGGTALGSDVSLLLYSAGNIDMSNSISFYGQMYGCKIAELKNSVTINYRSVGGDAPPTTTTTTTSTGTTQAAVFGGSSVSMRTKNTLFQSSDNAKDALVYAGLGGFECQNNGEVQGPLRSVASGATFKNSCTAASVTVPAPAWTFPTLPSRTSGGPDPLDSWRNKGWTVKVFSGSSSCSDALAYLADAQKSGTPEQAAWRTAPLLVVVRDCSSTLQWNLPKSMTLRNDLAVMSDTGIQDSDSSAKTLTSADSTAQRNFYWIVPSDTPKKTSSSCTADIEPGKVDVAASIRWLLYTPCDITPGKGFGKGSPVAGGVYAGGAVTLEQVELRFAPMVVPGLSGAGVTSSSGASSSPSPVPSASMSPTTSPSGSVTTRWSLTDVRDLSSR